MDPLGIVVHDDQGFLTKVVNGGMEQGIFTRDRADEIIRISVAMANKYVLHKEVDFRSTEELSRVQETILKLIGVGLEIRCEGDVDDGIRRLMDGSPVEFFRLANTRVEKLRHRWNLLLYDHYVEIFVSPEEYETLSDLTIQQLGEISIFSETEIETIKSLTLGDELFSNLNMVEYYESELARYEFILKLREILPFELLNRSPSVRAENIAEVDCLREAFLNTVIASAYVESEDPVSVSMNDVRSFLQALDLTESEEVFSPEVENIVLDLIHELAEGLDEAEAALLTKEVIHLSQKLVTTVANEWDTINSPSEKTFFKRWSRMVFLSDAPDALASLFASTDPLDEFDMDILMEQMLRRPEQEAVKMAEKIPWHRMIPDQIIRMLHEVPPSLQEELAGHAPLNAFTGPDLIDLLEEISSEAVKELMPALKKAFPRVDFSLEDLELMAVMQHDQIAQLLSLSKPPSDYEPERVINEFRDSNGRTRQVFFRTCSRSDFFHDLFVEAWSADAEWIKKHVRTLAAAEIGPFLYSASRRNAPRIVESDKDEIDLVFPTEEVTGLFRSLPKTKQKAAVRYFRKLA
jgi:uncharacterized protein DUF6178